MKVTILGAAGLTGRHLVEQALAAGHTVKAFARPGEDVGITNLNLSVVAGDARSVDNLKAALQGQDAVISALGSSKPGDELIARSTQALIDAGHAAGVKRVIMMSSFIVTPNYSQSVLAKLIGFVMKGIAADKTSGEELLKASDLEWTIVYATPLDKAPAGGPVRVVGPGEKVGLNNGIARVDVAKFMLEQLANPGAVRSSILITVK